MSKIYLGYKDGAYHLFRSATEPTAATHGEQYDFVFGAFRTKRGGEWAVKHALGNPHAQTVSECERLAKTTCKCGNPMSGYSWGCAECIADKKEELAR